MYLKTWLPLMPSLLPLYGATLLPPLAVRARGVEVLAPTAVGPARVGLMMGLPPMPLPLWPGAALLLLRAVGATEVESPAPTAAAALVRRRAAAAASRVGDGRRGVTERVIEPPGAVLPAALRAVPQLTERAVKPPRIAPPTACAPPPRQRRGCRRQVSRLDTCLQPSAPSSRAGWPPCNTARGSAADDPRVQHATAIAVASMPLNLVAIRDRVSRRAAVICLGICFPGRAEGTRHQYATAVADCSGPLVPVIICDWVSCRVALTALIAASRTASAPTALTFGASPLSFCRHLRLRELTSRFDLP